MMEANDSVTAEASSYKAASLYAKRRIRRWLGWHQAFRVALSLGLGDAYLSYQWMSHVRRHPSCRGSFSDSDGKVVAQPPRYLDIRPRSLDVTILASNPRNRKHVAPYFCGHCVPGVYDQGV